MLPVFDCSITLPDFFHFVLFAASLIAIALVFLFPQKKMFIWSVILLETLSCLLDQMRWQPWEYQYLLTFIFFLYYHRNPNDFIKLLAVLISATYVFSGLHKFSFSFLDSIWDKMILKDFFGFSKAIIRTQWVHFLGLLMAVFEVFIGVGLLLSRNKKIFVYLAIIMHGFLLLILGPLGVNFNKVVWPWNIAMILLVWVLFCRSDFQINKKVYKPLFNKAILILIVFLPTLNFFGFWDNYLSFNLYSGNNERVYICNESGSLPDNLTQYKSINLVSRYCSDNAVSISVNKLAFNELNVPLYPEERTYFMLKKEWLKKYPDHENVFIVYDYPYGIDNIREIP